MIQDKLSTKQFADMCKVSLKQIVTEAPVCPRLIIEAAFYQAFERIMQTS